LSIHKVWECGMYDTYTRGLTGSNPVLITYSIPYVFSYSIVFIENIYILYGKVYTS